MILMGLDTYAVVLKDNGDFSIEEAKRIFMRDRLSRHILLVGGIFSGNGYDGSFRGKCYNDLIETVTGYSLYNHLIDPEEVKEIYLKLVEFRKKVKDEKSFERWQKKNKFSYIMSLKEFDRLILFFKICVKHNLALHGWW